MWLFSHFQYGFRSSRSTADLLTFKSNRIARAFSRSVAARAVALDTSKAFDRVWHTGLLHKFKSYGISLLLLFSVIDSFQWFCNGSLHKNIQLLLEFLKVPFLALHFPYYILMTLLMFYQILLSIIDHITLYSKCDQASDLWQQLELVSELESDLRDLVD